MKLLHFKDFITMMNAGMGLLAGVLALRGYFLPACYCMIFAFVFDILDGNIARLTHTMNNFGKELDNIADLVSYSVGPAFIVYAYFEYVNPIFPVAAGVPGVLLPGYDPGLANIITGIVMGMFPLGLGSMRFARNNVYDVGYKGFWLGLPRPVSAYFIVAFVGSHLALIPYYNIVVIVAVILISYANLSYFPFMSDKNRKFPTSLKLLLTLALVMMLIAVPLSFITGEPYALDVLLFEMLVYLFGQFIYIKKSELAGINTVVKEIYKVIDKDMGRSK